MALFADSDVPVDLTQFWPAWQQLQKEYDQSQGYIDSGAFWTAYDTKLRDAADRLTRTSDHMATHSQWRSPDPNAASSAFYERVNAGVGSINAWLAGTTAVKDAFNT